MSLIKKIFKKNQCDCNTNQITVEIVENVQIRSDKNNCVDKKIDPDLPTYEEAVNQLPQCKMRVQCTDFRSAFYNVDYTKISHMHLELESAANFLIHLIKLARCRISELQLQVFKTTLIKLLYRKYADYWVLDRPEKHSRFRRLRFYDSVDPIILMAGEMANFYKVDLRKLFPSEMDLYIDPNEVSFQFGFGTVNILYDGNGKQPWAPQFTPCHNTLKHIDALLDPRKHR